MAKRRGSGEGTIFKRADGRWVAMLTVGHDENGCRRRRALYGAMRKEVAEKLAALQHDAKTGPLPEPERMTVGEFLDRWLSDVARTRVRETTYYTYRSFIRTHLKPRIGGVPLQRLTPPHFQQMLGAMERDGCGPRLRQAVHATLRRALADAVRWRLLSYNPCALVDRPRVPRREMRALGPVEARMLLDAARGNRLEALIVLALGTGARQGELMGLRWGDFDADAARLVIQRQVVDVNGKPAISEPKTAAGRRSIDLANFCVEALLRHREAQSASPHPTAWIFADEKGGPLRRQNFRRRVWEPLARAAGVPGLRFHDLRHSCASLLAARGVHPRVVQSILGHADVQTTLQVYSHVTEALGREAATKLDAMLGA